MKLAASPSFCLLLLFSARPTHAVIYQYFDEEGTLAAANVPPGSKKAAAAQDRADVQKIETEGEYPRLTEHDLKPEMRQVFFR